VLHSEVWPAFTQWIATFPSVPEDKRDADDDPDGDGLANLEEYARRSLPHTAQSIPPSLLARQDSVGVLLLVCCL
jgi:hypothetical protein